MKYKIKINGSGTAKEIVKSLRDIIFNLKEAIATNNEADLLNGIVFEDSILMTEINIDTDIE